MGFLTGSALLALGIFGQRPTLVATGFGLLGLQTWKTLRPKSDGKTRTQNCSNSNEN